MPPRSRLLARLLGAVIACSACGLPSGDYFGEVDPHPDPTRLRFCNSGEPEHIDPALVTSTTGIKIAYALFDGLTDHNLQGLPSRSIATGWEVSEDQRKYTFTLRRDARWSNGETITAHDFVYHLTRVLHPLTFSRNAEVLWKLKNAKLYTQGRVRVVVADAAPFSRGDVVEVVGMNGEVLEERKLRDAVFPDSNLRTSSHSLKLRDLGAAESDAYATVAPGREVTIVELRRHQGVTWAYVHRAEGDGVYGWVPAALLDGAPHAANLYTVRAVPRAHLPGRFIPVGEIDASLSEKRPSAVVPGAKLLMLPEALGVRAADDFTLVLESWGPFPQLIDVSPQRAFRATPRKAVSRAPLRWTRPENIITSGPFHLTEWHRRDRLELVKSATYWRAETVKLERITIYSMNDQAASTNYYMRGGCDAVTSNHIPSSYRPVLSGAKRGGRAYKDYTVYPRIGVYFYLINTEKVANVHFRRALNHAIDRRAFPRFLRGGEIPSSQAVPGSEIRTLSDADLALCGVDRSQQGVAMIVRSGELCYVPAPGLEFDLAKARKELALAREQMGAGYMQSFTLKYNTGIEGHKLSAEYVQDQWRKNLGLDVSLQSQEWKTYLKATTDGEYEVARLGWVGNFPDPEGEFLAMYRCGSPTNRTRWCNDEFEQLFTRAESTVDRKQRLALLRKAEEILISEAPIVPVYVYTTHHLQKPYVRDLAINLPDQVPLRLAWIDPDWRKKR